MRNSAMGADSQPASGGDIAWAVITMLFTVLVLAGAAVSVQLLRKKSLNVKKTKRELALAMNAIILAIAAIMTLYATYDVFSKSMGGKS